MSLSNHRNFLNMFIEFANVWCTTHRVIFGTMAADADLPGIFQALTYATTQAGKWSCKW